MNKSRRLVWAAGRQLAERGYLVIVPDLFGTGDSEGNFEDASWNTWLLDLQRTVRWLQTIEVAQISVLAVRFGACFLSSIVEFVDLERVVAWQPPRSGSEILRSMARAKALNMRMAGQVGTSTSGLLDQLYAGGQPLELAGYAIPPQLAVDVRDATFSHEKLSVRDRSLVVLFQKDRPHSDAVHDSAQDVSHDRPEAYIGGERFWLSMEPGPNDELVDTTSKFFERG